jgi:LacI family transcriptional regulator
MGYSLLLKALSNFSVNDVEPILYWLQSHQVDGVIWAVPEIGDNRKWLDKPMINSGLPILFMAMEERPNIKYCFN